MGAAQPESSEAGGDALGELRTLARALATHLERRADLGVQRVDRPRASGGEEARAVPAVPAAPAAAPRAARARADTLTPVPAPLAAPLAPESPAAEENRTRASACGALGELRALVAGCTACGLARTRTQTVFSDGSEHARLMFIGEAPGQSEDERGVPFVGAAGQLLTDIIQKGIGIARAEVYIANVLKCRPPGNRDPEPEEKALCTPYLDRQIELVDPAVIVTLGLHAARHLLRSSLSMGRLRGMVHAWNGRKVVATYHPAYLLRDPSAKKDCWQDIQLAMRELGLTPPAKGSPPPAR